MPPYRISYLCGKFFLMRLIVKNIRFLVNVRNQAVTMVKGPEMGHLPQVENGWLYCEDGLFSRWGTMNTLNDFLREQEIERTPQQIDAGGGMVSPVWCDSHTHIVFAATREQEFVDRIHGLSYEEIARRGGGILNSAKKLAVTAENELYDNALQRVHEMVRMGTGAIEIKSGYGLSFDAELMMLRVIRRIRESVPIPVRATFLGAHAIPAEYKEKRADYVALIIERMLPSIADEGLADFCDVFCDRGFFTVDETAQILEAGWKYGLRPKIHANELANSGGIQIGVKHRALSVDHLEFTGEEEMAVLKDSETMATLLPSTAFFLKLKYAPARKMIDAGLPVALATDYNPGSSPSGNMPFVLSLACIHMGMTPEEAINAATVNGAYAMGLSETHGSITPGKPASFFITDPVSSPAVMPYSFGSRLVKKTFINGKEF